MNTVDILKDTSTTIQDLTYSDIYSSEDWTGLYTPKIGADTINFNDRFFQARTSSWNKKTATHELGHALGLDDHDSKSNSSIIMYGSASTVTNLQAHDKEDYKSKW